MSKESKLRESYSIEISKLVNEISMLKAENKILIDGITRLQEKYDQNGYDLPPALQLQRIDLIIYQYKTK